MVFLAEASFAVFKVNILQALTIITWNLSWNKLECTKLEFWRILTAFITMTTVMYPTLTKSQSMRSKRKSAVELLAESKPFYVKSEIVRDTTQAQPARPPPTFAVTHGSYMRSKSVNVAQPSYRPITLPPCKLLQSRAPRAYSAPGKIIILGW